MQMLCSGNLHTTKVPQMDKFNDTNSFWIDKWKNQKIGFHNYTPHPFLIECIQSFNLNCGDAVFVPLCGKTSDISWLLDKGYHVVGVDLSEVAINALFDELGLRPTITKKPHFSCYRAPMIDVFVGDLFNLETAMLPKINLVYDRAALVALPPKRQAEYALFVTTLTDSAPQMIVTIEFDDLLINSPPYSVKQDDLYRIYGTEYTLSLIRQSFDKLGLKGKFPVTETCWACAPVPT